MSEALSPSPFVSVVEDVAQVGRALRSPRHDHQVRALPYQVTPFMIAPVLPGDSLERIDLQSTAVSGSIKNPLLGWWLEHQYYYVKLTDLDDADQFRNLMLSATADLTGGNYWDQGANTSMYLRAGGPGGTYDFVGACLQKVMEHYFRDDDEDYFTPYIDNLPLARARMPGRESWLESVQLDGTEGVPDPVIGDPDVRDPEDPYYEMWLRMQEMRLTDLTYELWLKDQGIRGVEVQKPQRPQLLRASRAFKKPSVTPDSSGNVGAVCYWDIKEDATKKRFFKEPGFIFGVTVARPKVYLSKQLGAASNDLLTNAFAWMPKALTQRPELALRKFADGDGPLGALPNPTSGYWVDVVDLFMYGDQFVNFSLSATDAGFVALPGPLLSKTDSLYPSRADIEGLFTSTATTGTNTGREIRQEGVTQLRILSRLRDLT